MTATRPTVFALLYRAWRRLRPHLPNLTMAIGVVLLGNILFPSLLVSPDDETWRLVLFMTGLVVWVFFLSFVLARMTTDKTTADIIQHLPPFAGRFSAVLAHILWHTWIFAAILGTCTLFIDRAGFGASVLLLWTITIIMAVIRGPRVILAPVFAFQQPHLFVTHSLDHSRHLTKKMWNYVALSLATVAGCVILAGKIATALLGTESTTTLGMAVLMAVSLAGQVFILATIVELKVSLEQTTKA